jgi:hypothetical protein
MGLQEAIDDLGVGKQMNLLLSGSVFVRETATSNIMRREISLIGSRDKELVYVSTNMPFSVLELFTKQYTEQFTTHLKLCGDVKQTSQTGPIGPLFDLMCHNVHRHEKAKRGYKASVFMAMGQYDRRASGKLSQNRKERKILLEENLAREGREAHLFTMDEEDEGLLAGEDIAIDGEEQHVVLTPPVTAERLKAPVLPTRVAPRPAGMNPDALIYEPTPALLRSLAEVEENLHLYSLEGLAHGTAGSQEPLVTEENPDHRRDWFGPRGMFMGLKVDLEQRASMIKVYWDLVTVQGQYMLNQVEIPDLTRESMLVQSLSFTLDENKQFNLDVADWMENRKRHKAAPTQNDYEQAQMGVPVFEGNTVEPGQTQDVHMNDLDPVLHSYAERTEFERSQHDVLEVRETYRPPAQVSEPKDVWKSMESLSLGPTQASLVQGTNPNEILQDLRKDVILQEFRAQSDALRAMRAQHDASFITGGPAGHYPPLQTPQQYSISTPGGTGSMSVATSDSFEVIPSDVSSVATGDGFKLVNERSSSVIVAHGMFQVPRTG